jgi:HAMP domain-containing protein
MPELAHRTPPPALPSVFARRDWWWVFDPRESLRAAAALGFGTAALLFAALVVWLAGDALHRHLEAQASATLETLAVQVSDKLDRALFERYRTLQLAASLPSVRAYGQSPADRRRVLGVLQETTPDFAWLGYVDATGRVIAGTRGHFEGTSVELRTWFRQARNQPYAGTLREIPELARLTPAPEADPTADTPAAPRFLDLAVPVSGADGEFAGVLAAHLRWDWSREVQTSVVPESARRQLLGVTVYGPDRETLLDSGGSGWTLPPDAPALPDPRRGRGAFTEPTAGGTTYLTGFMRSRGHREYRGLGWITAVRQPVDHVFAPVTALRRRLAGWGLVLSLTVALGAWWIAGRLSRRLRSVAAAAERIREGDVLAVLPSARGEGELERMCTSLGGLVEDLRARDPAHAPPKLPGPP